MDMKLKNAYVNEVKYQTQMLNQLKRWLKCLTIFSSLSLLIIIFGPSLHYLVRPFGIVMMIISIIGILFIGYGIKKGHDNISKILDYIDNK